MGQAAHKVVVYARQGIDAEREAMNSRESVRIKYVTLLNRYRHHYVVGTAESVFNIVVQLNVGMFLGQQVSEVGIHLQIGHTSGEERRRQQYHREKGFRMVEDEDFYHSEKSTNHTVFFHIDIPGYIF